MEASLRYAQQADASDPLQGFASHFNLPSKVGPKGYFCGHSLGAQPKQSIKHIEHLLNQWSELGVEAYFEQPNDWLSLAQDITPSLAQLVGAQVNEVNIMNSLTTNLHMMASSFYRPTKNRYKILMESDAFSSDKFAMASQARLHGFDSDQAMIWVQSDRKTLLLSTDKLIDTIEREHKQLALILLPAVQYLTGQVLDIQAIAQAARQYEIPIGVDCAHACGNIPLALHAWEVDFAVWCHYKYLNSGPGSPAGVFVHQKHHQQNLPRMAGWWGQKRTSQFDFKANFDAIEDIRGWQLSCPPLLSMVPLKASLDLFEQAGFENLCNKSTNISAYLLYLIQTQCPSLTVITPLQARGAQTSLKIGKKATSICERLKQAGYYVDARIDLLRIAPVPLYNTYVQVFDLVMNLKKILGEQDAVA